MDVKTEATNKAQEVLAAHWGEAIPVDPAQIARKMGIEVASAQLDPDVAGAIEKRHGHPAIIYLSAGDHPNRKRFTCAHEVGHFVRNGNENFEYVDYRDGTASMGIDEDERFANAFAAALLMPEREVRRLHGLGMPEGEMCGAFGVSEAAMVNRLKNLNLYR
ncbi:MAG TPA: ImmA/IrrE family metallo-endopeptidase [Solirubrobacterales bacterium]|nr:ImmA/IrrE family metallo-endopeptidase [Solirubrobacterales bacterium]